MNSNWTGRAPRTLAQCHFRDDANPFERTHRRSITSDAEIVAYILALLGVLFFVWWVA